MRDGGGPSRCKEGTVADETFATSFKIGNEYEECGIGG